MSASMKETMHNLSNIVNNEKIHGNVEVIP